MKVNNKKIKTKYMATVLVLVIATLISLTGCGAKKVKKVEETTKKADETVAIHAGNTEVYLDEAKYYAYTAQATYETYYLTKNKEINWSSKTKAKITMDEMVKSTVLDDICRRECMYEYGMKNGVKLEDEEKQELDLKLENYYKLTSPVLVEKIRVERKRLQKIFEKDAIAKKTEEVLDAMEKNLAEKTYKTWKNENTVTAEKQWEEITFSKPIFTLKDLN